MCSSDLSGTGAVPAGASWVREAYGVHTLVLRSGVTEVGENAFRDFGSLKEVYYVGDETAWEAFRERIQAGNDPLLDAAVTLAVSGDCGEAAAWSLSEDETVLTISGSGPMADYRSAKEAPWRYSADAVTTLRVESGVTTLGDYAFQNFRNLTDVRLPASLERVGTYTFTGCYALTEIHIPEGVRIIAAKAFSDAKNLKAVYLPASLEAVDMKAFNYDTAIKDVYYAGTQRQWDRLCRCRCPGRAGRAAGCAGSVSGACREGAARGRVGRIAGRAGCPWGRCRRLPALLLTKRRRLFCCKGVSAFFMRLGMGRADTAIR